MITARFTGTCPTCELTIAKGSHVEQDPDTRQWVHADCLDELHDTRRETRTVCPDCHTTVTVTGACLCEEDA